MVNNNQTKSYEIQTIYTGNSPFYKIEQTDDMLSFTIKNRDNEI